MTHVIHARNVNTALHDGLWWLKVAGITENSRNGPVVVAPGPVITEYERPTERVLFSAARDANPHFHFFESCWMLSGRNDLAWVQQFNSRFGEFSDDGETLHGAYGHRWRKWFGFDQLEQLIIHLRENPNSRRAVLSMWSPVGDLHSPSGWTSSPSVSGLSSKDLPCNTQVYFDCRGDRLNMTVMCRSNDSLWGCYGANSVHFSYLHEYTASSLGLTVGVYRQFSNNFHAYLELKGYPPTDPMIIGCDDRYAESVVKPYPLIQVDQAAFDLDLSRFMSDPAGDTAFHEPFFDKVAAPMYASWHDRKRKKNNGRLAAEAIEATDWKTACCDWIGRREANRVTA